MTKNQEKKRKERRNARVKMGRCNSRDTLRESKDRCRTSMTDLEERSEVTG